MSLQSSGIIVVDKTSLISSTVSTSAGPSIINTICRSNQEQGHGGRGDEVTGDGGRGGVEGEHFRIHSLQQEQQSNIEWNKNHAASLPEEPSSSTIYSKCNRLFQQQQCIKSSTPSTSLGSRSKATTESGSGSIAAAPSSKNIKPLVFGNHTSSSTIYSKCNRLFQQKQCTKSSTPSTLSGSRSIAAAPSSKNVKPLVFGNHNFNQINQQRHQHQHHHYSMLRATTAQTSINLPNQLICNEKFIEHASFANATTMLIDPLGNVTAAAITTTATTTKTATAKGNNHPYHHGNSKLLVGKLTVLSKQRNVTSQSQQTINFINEKNLPYLTANTKNPIQTTIAMDKIINTPLKNSVTNNLIKSSSMVTPSQLHHHHHIKNNSNIQNIAPGMQNITAIPHNVQVVTRVQDAPKIVSSSSSSSSSSTTGKINNVTFGIKNQSTKTVDDQKLNAENSAISMQSLKQFSDGQQNTQNQQAMANSGVGASSQIYTKRGNNNNSTEILTMQQQQFHQTAINASGTYTINNNKINNITIPIQQQQNSGTLTTTTAGNDIKNLKYLLPNHIMLPRNATNTQSSIVQQNLNNKIPIDNGNNVPPNNIIVEQQIINSINCNNNNSCNISGCNCSTIKFINAHDATILQTQPQSAVLGGHNMLRHASFQHGQQNQKLKNYNNHHHQMMQTIHIPPEGQQHSTSYIDEIKVIPFPVPVAVYLSAATSGLTGSCRPTPGGSTNEDYLIVNGTSMTDELSTRILHEMSQKSIFHNNNNQKHQKHIQHKFIGSSLSSTISSQHHRNLILCPNVERDYPLYSFINPGGQIHQHQRHRSQSLDRKSPKSQSTIMKRSASYVELFRIKGDNTPATKIAQYEDDIIGEEVRPVPVIVNDIRLQSLHAILQDHTYVTPKSNRRQLELKSESNTILSQNNSNTIVGASTSTSITSSDDNVDGRTVLISSNTINLIEHHTEMSKTTKITSDGNNTSCDAKTSKIGIAPGQIAHRPHQHDDDNTNSAINNESKTELGLDNNLGEETESAPEAEAEDDSTTRCICDLTHDDGYMICCDKCFAWQHIVCMGIDRENIPDEYLCEICQPRQVDRVRARNLQLIKRKELDQLLINAQLNTGTANAGVSMITDAQKITANQKSDRIQQLPVTTNNHNNNNNEKNKKTGKKGKLLSSISKKKDLLKKNTKEKANNSKKRECKRIIVTKRKTKSFSNNESNQNERYASNLRQLIENYEIAVTNHYSPELRARLHAISKQPNLLQQIIATENKLLKTYGNNIDNKCTTVPHAGGKILISNLDIKPNRPIVELRGKYMLTTQYKNQNPSINMNGGMPTTCQQLVKNQKTPGPFIFFYQLYSDGGVGPEICVDTRTYGNEARFVRRSCRPNAKIQHTFKKGTIHLYLVSLLNIMASTEITIRHEPHDLLALKKKKTINSLIAPTSTMCACGLIKDCAFANVKTTTNTKISRTININGCLNKVNVTNGKKNPQSRGRSASSSCDSNIGLISPSTNFTPNMYGSSSSPSVSIQSSTHSQAINTPPQQINLGQQQQVPPILQQQTPGPISSMLNAPTTSLQILPNNIVSSTKSPQRMVTINRKTPTKSRRNTSKDSNIINPIEGAKSGGKKQTKGKRESSKLTREERKMEAIVRAFEKMEKNQQRKQELKQIEPSTSKRRNSSSPSCKRLKFQTSYETNNNTDNTILSSITQLATASPDAELSVSRKKNRRFSISYQIQDNSQRKMRSSRINSNVSDVITSEESVSLLSAPMLSSGHINLSSNMSLQTATTENQITLGQNLIGRQIEKPTSTTAMQSINQNAAELLLALSSSNENQSTEYCTRQQTIRINSADIDDPDSTTTEIAEQQIPQSPETPPIVSSTCLLVEAAVGQLENYENINSGDFKLPVKTKQSLMNDWLNQSNDFQQTEDEETQKLRTQIVQNSPCTGLDTLVQAAATMHEYQCSISSPSSCMVCNVSKKFQEFNYQSDAGFNSDNETTMRIESSSEQSFNTLSLPQSSSSLNIFGSSSSNTLGSSSSNTLGSTSLKKRWLRRSISEEIDEITAENCLPATIQANDATTSNCFRTPLKKRRLVRQYNEEEQGNNTISNYNLNNEDSTTLTTESIKINKTQLGKETHEILVEVEKDSYQIKDAEAVNVEDYIDIITLSSPGDKIFADDNFVKIQPEDVTKEIEVNVDKEESYLDNLINKDMDMFATTNTRNEQEDYVKLKQTAISEEEQVKMEDTNEEAEKIQNKSESLISLNFPISTEKPLIDNSSSSSSSSSNSYNKVIKTDIENYKSFSNEIADIQNRLNLFHKENIKILQLRNRKSLIARSLKLALSKFTSSAGQSSTAIKQQTSAAAGYYIKLERSPPKTEFKIKSMKKKHNKSTRHHNSKKHFQNFDSIEKVDRKRKLKNEIKKQKDEDLNKFEYRKTIKNDIFRIDDKQLQAELTIPNFNHNIFPQNNPSNPVYSYVTNVSTLSNITCDIASLVLAPPPPPPPTPQPVPKPLSLSSSSSLSAIHQTPSVVQNIFPVAGGYITNYSNNVTPSTLTLQPTPLYLPYYNTIYGKLIENNNVGTLSSSSSSSSSSSLNLGTSSSAIPTSNHQLSHYIDTKLKSYNSTLVGGYVSYSPLFSLNNPKPNSSSISSGGGISSGTPLMPTSSSLNSSMSSASSNSKFLTKTAIADPRLNPILTAPEPPPPPPKRKLSINEYRKRKQQSIEKVTTPTDSQTAVAVPEYSSKFGKENSEIKTNNDNNNNYY